MLTQMFDSAELLQLDALPLDLVLFDWEHPLVLADLQRIMESKAEFDRVVDIKWPDKHKKHMDQHALDGTNWLFPRAFSTANAFIHCRSAKLRSLS